MTDEKPKKGTEYGGIEFNPPVPEIYGDAKDPIPQEGDHLAPAAPAETVAESVGLKLSPNSRVQASNTPDFKQILQEVKLPERRVPPGDASPVTTQPSAPPLGASAPELSPAQKGVATIPIAAQESTEERSPVVSLHTMKDDIQDAVRDQQISVVRAASLEAQKRAQKKPAPVLRGKEVKAKEKRHPALLPATMIVVFIALGGLALYAAHFFTSQQGVSTPPMTGIIFAEQQSTLPIGQESVSALRQTLSNMLASQGSGAGSIMQVTPIVSGASGQAARKATLEEFLHALGAHPPSELLRALSGDFFFGIHAADSPSTVFVIPVTSYDHAFAGMLAWEGAINLDLSPLFKQAPAYLPPVSSTSMPLPRKFQDYQMRNYDTRILRDDGGSVVLYYSFTPQQNFLILASSPYTFPEVLSRLQAQRKL